jgi:hypothetical protein
MANSLDWDWRKVSNWSLLSKPGNFTDPYWWWFRPEKRPALRPYILMNHQPNSWVPTYKGCAFNPNKQYGKNFTVRRGGFVYEYFVYENTTLVSLVPVSRGVVVAQVRGPRLTGGLGICGVRYFPPGVPVKVNFPF